MNTDFEIEFQVLPEHLDALQHVNNVVYVQWMQDIASQHWNILASAELNEKIIWVVRRHEIEYMAQALLQDALIMKTWIGESSGITSIRHYEIIRKSDHKKIIEAKSAWILLDKKTLRPKRIDEEVLSVLK
jgi:acyl-CoA thioester hydrolase